MLEAIAPTMGEQTPRGCRCSPVPVFGYRTRQTLQRLDVSRLQTLGALLRFEAHLLVFSQRLEAVAADFREVSEQVVAALVRSNEAKAFAVVEPLNGTGIHEESLRKKKVKIAPSGAREASRRERTTNTAERA